MPDVKYDLLQVANGFQIKGTYVESHATGDGHINDTYKVKTKDNTSVYNYIIQRINHHVFKKPWEVMDNIIHVTEHIAKKLELAGDGVRQATLRFIPAKDGKFYLMDAAGNYWRCYYFVGGARSYQMLESPGMFYNVGEEFGSFQRYLADYPAETLHETIPMFHNTQNRFRNFVEAVEADSCNRAYGVKEEIEKLLARESLTGKLLDGLKDGTLPLRVTHNDTKVNNVLLDDETKKGVCVIDLDTVMPGLAAYDFGDAIRVGASTAAEDEKDVSKVGFDMELFTAFAHGFIDGTGGLLTKAEIESLPAGALLMTYENGLRFLTDYLSGDTYFKIAYPDHNLVRCRTQIRMVECMESAWDQMMNIVRR